MILVKFQGCCRRTASTKIRKQRLVPRASPARQLREYHSLRSSHRPGLLYACIATCYGGLWFVLFQFVQYSFFSVFFQFVQYFKFVQYFQFVQFSQFAVWLVFTVYSVLFHVELKFISTSNYVLNHNSLATFSWNVPYNCGRAKLVHVLLCILCTVMYKYYVLQAQVHFLIFQVAHAGTHQLEWRPILSSRGRTSRR